GRPADRDERWPSRSGPHHGAIVVPPHSSGAVSRTVWVSSQRWPPGSSRTPDRSPYSYVLGSSTTRAPQSRARAKAASTSGTRTLRRCVTTPSLGPTRSARTSATTTAPSDPTRNWARCGSPIRTRSSNPNAASSHATAARTSGYMSTAVTVTGGAERFVNMAGTVTAVERKGGAMTSIQPELWVETPREAVEVYEAAFGATVLHRVGDGDDIVAQLGVGDAAFWVAATSATMKRLSPGAIDGATSRTLLVVE